MNRFFVTAVVTATIILISSTASGQATPVKKPGPSASAEASGGVSAPNPQLEARINRLIMQINLKPNLLTVNESNVVMKEPNHQPYHPDGTRNQDFTVRPDLSHPNISQALNVEQNRDKWTNELIQIGKPAVPALVKALTNEKYEYRYYYARALGGIKDMRAVPTILKYYEDGGKQVNLAKLIRMSGDEAAARECENKGVVMKKAAVDALEQISGQKYGDDYAKWKAWWDQNKTGVDAIPVPKHYSANPVTSPQ